MWRVTLFDSTGLHLRGPWRRRPHPFLQSLASSNVSTRSARSSRWRCATPRAHAEPPNTPDSQRLAVGRWRTHHLGNCLAFSTNERCRCASLE